jgi:hypothetical protein
VRALPQEIGVRWALVGAVALLALSLLILSLAMLWMSILSHRQEAAEQAAREENAIAVPPEAQPEDFPLLFSPGPAFGSAEVTSASGRARGIPGLTEMEVIGNLQYLPDSNFRCSGASPDQGLIRRGCTSTKDDDSAVYEVALLEEDPATVLSVRATARNASDDAVAEFLSYVARLSLGNEGGMDAESWVDRNLSSGGQYFADGTEVKLYGTEGTRTLDIVVSAPPANRSPETTTNQSSRDAEATTNRRP